MNIVMVHPKVVAFGIGLGITFVIGITLGKIDHNQAYAVVSQRQKSSQNN